MNTQRIHQIRTAAFTTVVAFIACASTASPASAGESRTTTAREAPGPTVPRRSPCASRPSTA